LSMSELFGRTMRHVGGLGKFISTLTLQKTNSASIASARLDYVPKLRRIFLEIFHSVRYSSKYRAAMTG